MISNDDNCSINDQFFQCSNSPEYDFFHRVILLSNFLGAGYRILLLKLHLVLTVGLTDDSDKPFYNVSLLGYPNLFTMSSAMICGAPSAFDSLSAK